MRPLQRNRRPAGSGSIGHPGHSHSLANPPQHGAKCKRPDRLRDEPRQNPGRRTWSLLIEPKPEGCGYCGNPPIFNGVQK